MEKMVAHNAKVYKRKNLRMHGVGKSWWTSLPTSVVSLSNHLSRFQVWTTFLCMWIWDQYKDDKCNIIYIWIWSKDQPIITTKIVNPIRGGTSLEIIHLPIATLAMHVAISLKLIIPSVAINNKVKSLEFLFIYYHTFDPPRIDVSLKITLISNTRHA